MFFSGHNFISHLLNTFFLTLAPIVLNLLSGSNPKSTLLTSSDFWVWTIFTLDLKVNISQPCENCVFTDKPVVICTLIRTSIVD